jgi:tetratricopeptide (TPR) repeat protein
VTRNRTALIIIGAAYLLLTGVGSAAAQHHDHPAGDAATLGRVTFPVSCAPEVQESFNVAVAMLHSFWFEAAEEAFAGIIARDPSCAMAHWGTAMTLMGNPMTRAPAPPDRLEAGHAAAERAAELAAGASPRERLYIDAVLTYYRDRESRDHLARMREFERVLAELKDRESADMEATIFYARTVVANASPDDQSFAALLAAGALLEPLFEQHPDHPGLAHYLIHAYDVPSLAEHAVDAAFAYASIAPDAPHALHMPSHIFTRLGYWDESIETNARSAQAEPDPDGAVHPMDYMVYAYLQQGRNAEARAVTDRAVQNPDRFYGGLLGYNFAAMPARFALERSAWREAATLRVPVGALPYVEAITRFARAVGAARSGDAAAAAVDVAALQELTERLHQQRDAEWAARVGAQHRAAAAWVAYAGGDVEAALADARAAADLEETVEKHPVTPGPLLPARELYGDMLMEAGRYRAALAEYERTLEREPRRARALFGAARAAERAGERGIATARYRELLEVMAGADADRPEPAKARAFLAGG